MDLTIDSLRFVDGLGIEEGLRLIAEAGFDGVDLSLYPYGSTEDIRFLYRDDYWDRVKLYERCFAELGLSHRQAHAPFTFRYGMKEDESCEEYKIMIRAIEAAAYLGSRQIVVHGLSLWAGASDEENISWNAGYYSRFEPYARKYGIKIGVENISGSCRTPHMHAEVMKRLDPEWFVCVVDAGHALGRGGIQPGDFIRKLPYGTVKGLHVQDTVRQADYHHLPYLHDVDFPDFLKSLKEMGFEGDFTLEVQKFCKPYVEQGLARPVLAFAHAVGRKLLEAYEAL